MKRDFSSNATKAELRREMRARVAGLTVEVRAEASLVICQTAAHLPAFIRSRCIALFSPLLTEPDVRPLIEEAWAQGKRVVLPLMIKQKAGPQLDWHEVADWDEVTLPGPFGLREPDLLKCARVACGEIDCAFIPGLAFDEEGVRLGRGGGFYDYFLSRAGATMTRCGLMFAGQRVPVIPREPHDQSLSEVITEDGLTLFQS